MCLTFSDYIGIISLLITIAALGYTIWQSRQTKTAAEAAKYASEYAQKQIHTILMASELSRHNEIITALHANIAHNQIEIAIHRLTDVINILSELTQHSELNDEERAQLNRLLEWSDNDMQTLITCVQGELLELNRQTITHHLTQTSIFLKTIETRIKNK